MEKSWKIILGGIRKKKTVEVEIKPFVIYWWLELERIKIIIPILNTQLHINIYK